MTSSCDPYQREVLSALPEGRLNMGFQKTGISAMPRVGMTAFFEGYVVKSVWGLRVPQSWWAGQRSQGPTHQVIWADCILSCLMLMS